MSGKMGESCGGHRIALVLLAAGDSRRFGGNKLLADVDGKPMYRHLADELDRLLVAIFFRRIVVSQYPAILSELSVHGYETVENHHSELGISHSIHLALEALRRGERACGGMHDGYTAVCFAVCDQPWLKGDTVLRLVWEWADSGKGLGCLSFGGRDGEKGRDGNPAIFSRRYEPELLALSGDTGGRAVIRRHLDDLYRCRTADERELEDIDVRQCL